jgi:Carboxypeptidase regulatory-like domain/TonB dependent receptor/TonB-dependent Receptor Plug Domain
MARLVRGFSASLVAASVAFAAFSPVAVRAGTTGAIAGRIVDAITSAAVAGARVSVTSPSQSETATTDANGGFGFLSLAPDTYTVVVVRAGYQNLVLAGVTVQADQTQTLNRALTSLQRIGGTTVRRATDLVKPGTTSDVYSVNGALQDATQALGGPGGLSNAYSAIQSIPGTVVQQGQQGWYQQLSIRGGDIDQVGYELDGIPVNRVYDNAPQTMLSALGQQELQVYTGGTPATSDGQGLSGYVNQVIKTGTYPGFGTLQAGLGTPAFFHRLSFETGGATKNRNFSYYVGLAGANQDYRYSDANNGASDPQLFYPIAFPFGDSFNRFNIWDGSPIPGTPAGVTIPATVGNGLYFAGPNVYAIANTAQRDNVVNLHWALPHGKDGLKDDIQALYLTSEISTTYYGSVNDQGGPVTIGNALDVGSNGLPPGSSGPYQAFWHDGFVYNGRVFAPPNAALVTPYQFMSSPSGRALDAPTSNSLRDSNDNGVAVLKLQYQRNIDPRSFLRLFGYSVYSNWFITGDANQNFTCCFGAELNDYEIPSHTYGASLIYSNQITDKHLLTFGATESRTKIQRRYFYGFPGNQGMGTAFTNLIDPSNAAQTGHCYDPGTGTYTSCFNGPRGTFASPTMPITAGAFTGGANPQWLVTENGPLGRVNNVSPVFSAVSLNDTWTPTDKLTLTLGLRVENYTDRLDSTAQSPTARSAANRAFWIKAYDNEYCYKPGVFGAQNVSGFSTPDANGVFATPANCAAFGPGYVPANFVNTSGGTLSSTTFQPRVAFTYAANADTVLRGSYGVYSRPVNTSWLQYNNLNDRDYLKYAASNFLGYGFNTPVHGLRPDTSYNYDLSLEQHLRGDVSYKATPFYRSTRDQLEAFPIGVGGIVSGFNVGHQTSYGLELALRKGDFNRKGFAGQLAYTYTHSRIKYTKFPSGTNVIDSINLYVKEYNAYTSFCASNPNDARCGTTTSGVPAAACYNSGGAAVACGTPNAVANPYFNQPVQPLFPVDAEYTTYDQIPQPFVGSNGYETPHVVALVLNYKYQKLTVTPSLTFSSGASYGSPLSYPGFIPNGNCTDPAHPYSCTGAGTVNPNNNGFSNVSGLDYLFIPNAFTGRFDNLGAFKEPSRLTLNLQTSYDLSSNTRLTLTLTGLIDKCFQRGYAWDDPNICVYSELPSGGAGLGPSGNFVPVAQTPVQLRYPYGMFSDNLNTGFIGTKIPFQAAIDLRIRL